MVTINKQTDKYILEDTNDARLWLTKDGSFVKEYITGEMKGILIEIDSTTEGVEEMKEKISKEGLTLP